MCLVECSKKKLATTSLTASKSAIVPAAAPVLMEAGFVRTATENRIDRQRRHNFTERAVITLENCLPCGNRCVIAISRKSELTFMPLNFHQNQVWNAVIQMRRLPRFLSCALRVAYAPALHPNSSCSQAPL